MSEPMTPLERAARALYDRWLARPDVAREAALNGPHPPWEKLDFGQQRWIDDARAVLTAIREPSEAWVSAAMKIGDENNTVIAWGDYPEFWQAMIDAALADGE